MWAGQSQCRQSLTNLYPVSIAVLITDVLPVWMRVRGRGIFHTPTILQCSVLWLEGLRTPERSERSVGGKDSGAILPRGRAGADHL